MENNIIKMHQGKIKFSILFLFTIMLFSCKGSKQDKASLVSSLTTIFEDSAPDEIPPVEYISFIEENENLKVSKKFDDITFSIEFQPTDYLIAKELSKEQIKKSELDSLRKEYDGMEYFLLSIKNNEETDLLKYKIKTHEEYSNRLSYFSFKINNDLQMYNGKDTVLCSFAHYERTFGVSPESKFLLAFSKNSKLDSEDRIIIFNDQLFGLGMVKLKIPSEYINEIPKLEAL